MIRFTSIKDSFGLLILAERLAVWYLDLLPFSWKPQGAIRKTYDH